ncbi:MAG: cbb3-type cytochrome oxidase assembly protein CcoS [Pseudomonadales bacterium]|jgi:cbb3-type cytochrome oxidase maturation protein|nr:cbb3-type cytochrome oxidase assembly protein CcoS [Pseudomonadales bacterium]MDP4640114.1 cbb3-type cytochrome oxidase assembly protein CcoS [Pseudomonadales bacterium]MDP4766555.1 cbb3-type cytochrome oxidase assembly protein CcoS [Pseudomonadales bacterium]MDP4876051.1 cbb3-type cytochrome oxidase assembly protein CcoS [Pseudomonadales bacterium]MDP4912219.1 cbb3-type cytochrome oxidase assembly protein CcoS [Pseudomonadales bacterium]
MEVVFVLVPISLLIVVIALWAFVWSVRGDQYDDLDKEAHRILFEDESETAAGAAEKPIKSSTHAKLH